MTRSRLLLHTICDLIEDPALAARIRVLDPEKETTFAEAYCAVRHVDTVPPRLREALLNEIFERSDAETARVLAARRREEPATAGPLAQVVPLQRRAPRPSLEPGRERSS